MQTYEFTLKGMTPYLMHADDVIASDGLMAWRKAPGNKSVSVPGDDRSPAWTWQTYLYADGEKLAIPSECLMTALRKAGAMIPAKGKATFKSLTQSGMLITSDFCAFAAAGREVDLGAIHRLRDLPFGKQAEGVRKLGFELMVKRAKVGESKHVRVRAKFAAWEMSGAIEVIEPAITPAVLDQLFEIAGRAVGLGDWRPSAPKSPGPYGMFTATIAPAGKGARRAS